MREYFEVVKGVRPDELLSNDVRRHAAEVLGAPASTLSNIGAALASLAALTVPHFDDQMSICYWWQVRTSGTQLGVDRERYPISTSAGAACQRDG
jgi:hypothetical protein